MRRAARCVASPSPRLLGPLAVGCSRAASAPETEGASASLIVGGKLATVESYEGIIQTGERCSGRVVRRDPHRLRVAVTAAHCVFDDPEMAAFNASSSVVRPRTTGSWRDDRRRRGDPSRGLRQARRTPTTSRRPSRREVETRAGLPRDEGGLAEASLRQAPSVTVVGGARPQKAAA